MKRLLYVLILLCVAGAGYVWYQNSEDPRGEAAIATEKITEVTAGVISKAGETARELSDTIKETIDEWDLQPDMIKIELAETGQIVRENLGVIGDVVKESAGDAMISSRIKAKFALSQTLSAWKISVDTDDGEVTLTGTVKSEENVGEAAALALDQEGVQKVTARLKVEP